MLLHDKGIFAWRSFFVLLHFQVATSQKLSWISSCAMFIQDQWWLKNNSLECHQNEFISIRYAYKANLDTYHALQNSHCENVKIIDKAKQWYSPYAKCDLRPEVCRESPYRFINAQRFTFYYLEYACVSRADTSLNFIPCAPLTRGKKPIFRSKGNDFMDCTCQMNISKTSYNKSSRNTIPWTICYHELPNHIDMFQVFNSKGIKLWPRNLKDELLCSNREIHTINEIEEYQYYYIQFKHIGDDSLWVQFEFLENNAYLTLTCGKAKTVPIVRDDKTEAITSSKVFILLSVCIGIFAFLVVLCLIISCIFYKRQDRWKNLAAAFQMKNLQQAKPERSKEENEYESDWAAYDSSLNLGQGRVATYPWDLPSSSEYVNSSIDDITPQAFLDSPAINLSPFGAHGVVIEDASHVQPLNIDQEFCDFINNGKNAANKVQKKRSSRKSRTVAVQGYVEKSAIDLPSSARRTPKYKTQPVELKHLAPCEEEIVVDNTVWNVPKVNKPQCSERKEKKLLKGYSV